MLISIVSYLIVDAIYAKRTRADVCMWFCAVRYRKGMTPYFCEDVGITPSFFAGMVPSRHHVCMCALRVVVSLSETIRQKRLLTQCSCRTFLVPVDAPYPCVFVVIRTIQTTLQSQLATPLLCCRLSADNVEDTCISLQAQWSSEHLCNI